MDEVFWCTACLNMSTRPRLTFDADGRCSACLWAEKKREVDWAAREEQLHGLFETARERGGPFDCLVPVSGGKDGSYVAYTLQERYGANPLTVTIRPSLELDLGVRNLLNFVERGFEHIHVTPNAELMRRLDRLGFETVGFPYYGWLTAILTAVIRVAITFETSLIFYGDDGEVEYGGTTSTRDQPWFDTAYMRDVYLEGGYESVMKQLGSERSHAWWWEFPTDEEAEAAGLRFTHWSYFEPWDPYRNYLVAKEKCGLEESKDPNVGTFTNFAQNDQALYALHTYLMYLKFGFGRATQDAGIEIRRGAMTREQAVNLVRMYDGAYPEQFVDTYLDYYEMTSSEFDAVLDRFANRDLFEKRDGRWHPKFVVE